MYGISSLYFFFFLIIRRPPRSTRTYPLFPYTTLFRSKIAGDFEAAGADQRVDPVLLAFVHETVRRHPFDATRRRDVEQLHVWAIVGLVVVVVRARPLAKKAIPGLRSEERRVGKECVSTCRSRWSPYH